MLKLRQRFSPAVVGMQIFEKRGSLSFVFYLALINNRIALN
jgi:hypothetical protein